MPMAAEEPAQATRRAMPMVERRSSVRQGSIARREEALHKMRERMSRAVCLRGHVYSSTSVLAILLFGVPLALRRPL
eukprot:417861-Prymnesium_polylepis.1